MDKNGTAKGRRAKVSSKKAVPGKRPRRAKAKQGSARDAQQGVGHDWQALVETSAAWIWETDADLRHIYTNAFVTTCLGYAPAEFLALSTIGLVHPDDHALLRDMVQAAATGEGWTGKVLRWRHKDGSWRHIESSGVAVFDRKGNFKGLRGVDRDITDRIKAEAELRESEGRFRALFENLSVVALVIDPKDGGILDANGAAAAYYGWTQEQLRSMNIALINTLPPAEIRALMQEVKDRKRRFLLLRHRRADGSVRDVEVYSGPISFEGKTALYSIIHDVTERNQASEALKQSEERFRTAFQTSPDAVVITRLADGMCVSINRGFTEITGYAEQEVIGRTTVEMNIWGDPEEREKMAEDLRSTGTVRDLEGRFRTKGGKNIYGLVSASVISIDGVPHILSVTRDITARKQAEEALRESEAALRQAQQLARIGSWRYEMRDDRVWWSDELFSIFGVTRDAGPLSPEFLFSRIHPDDRETFRSQVASREPHRSDYRIVMPDGAVKYIHEEVRVDRYEQGAAVRMFGTAQDITGLKNAEARIKESEKKYRDLFEASNDGIYILDLEGNFIDANPAAYRRLGYTREELLSLHISEVDTPEYADKVPGRLKQLREQGAAVFESANRRKDGSVMQIEVSARLLEYEGKPVVVSVNRDITERRRAEEKLRESESRLNTILDNVGAAIFIKDAKYRYTYVNRKVCETFGRTPEEILGKGDDAFFSEASVEEIRRSDRPVIESGETVSREEGALTSSDGVSRTYWTVKLPLRDSSGGVSGLCGISTDITDRKRAEEENKRLARAVSIVTEGIAVTDEQDRFIYLNDAHAKIYGYVQSELMGKTWRDITPREFVPLIDQEMARTLRSRENGVWSGEAPGLCKNGTGIATEVTATARWNEKGEYAGHICVVRDITERKRAEEELRASEERFRAITMTASDAILLMDDNGMIVYWNPAAARIFGYSTGEAVGKDLHVFLAPQRLHGEYDRGFARFLMTGQGPVINRSVEMVAVHKDGREFPIEVSTSALNINGKWHALGIVRDITERTRAEEELREKENRYRMLFEAANDGIFIQDSTGFRDCNRRGAEMYGLTREEIIGRSPTEFAPERQPDGRLSSEVAAGKVQAALSGVPQVFEWQSLRAGGTAFDVEVTLSRLELGGELCLQAIVRDITERKLADEALRASEARFRTIIENAVSGILVADVETGKSLYANSEICRMLGRSRESLLELDVYSIHPASEIERVRRSFATAEGLQTLCLRKDGTSFPAEIRVAAIELEGKRCLAGFIADLTEKRLLEEERLKTQKLESVGTLAGGIAHDFNNLLQGVFGYISMARLSLGQKERAAVLLEQAEKALHQSVNLTSQLLTFSKGGKPVKKVIDLLPVIENAAKFALSGSRSDFQLDIGPGLWHADADGGQLGQVIQNIVLNADQAMPLGGRIEIKARNVHAHDRGVPQVLKQGDYVEISIKDSGIGIPQHFLPRIFDPYFTTKEKGSGLGLATSYSIIRNHDGLIDVTSEVGTGSTFTIYLPASEAERADVEEKPVASAGRRLRVLVMDDEEVVRKVAVELLHELGHDVEWAAHGAAAVDVYRKATEAGRPFDIVILDLTIRGGMGGMETLRRLQEFDSQVKAVVSSGYSDDEIISDFRKRGFSAFLKKPYDLSVLRDMLQTLMR